MAWLRFRKFVRDRLDDQHGYLMAGHSMMMLLHNKVDSMAKTIDQILQQGAEALAKIKANDDLDASILLALQSKDQLIKDLRAQLAEAANDPAKIAALGDLMDQIIAKQDAENAAKVEAVPANTDAANV